mmetsp:Transcript_67568/g.152916  ORF Transcript_67568/g.152916 Transcript_67568/m.152916 type:complete len:233 (+) Transcript_67568:527-1225(+)
MFRSAGGGGTAALWRPSSPAAPTAAAMRYGFAAMSARRSSIRGAPPGTRTRAVRLLPAQVAAVGDQVDPELVERAPSRLYEFTAGFVRAQSAGACSSRPARKLSARGERPWVTAAPLSALSRPVATAAPHTFSPVAASWSERWAWQPDPVRSAKGLGMKVALKPRSSASDRTMYLNSTTLSAVTRQSAKSKLISNWPLASSWSAWYGPQPILSMCSHRVETRPYRRISAWAS